MKRDRTRQMLDAAADMPAAASRAVVGAVIAARTGDPVQRVRMAHADALQGLGDRLESLLAADDLVTAAQALLPELVDDLALPDFEAAVETELMDALNA